MSKEESVTPPRHPIQVVARRTGLTPDVIRVWERRYAAVSPSRSDTRRRLYSDEEVERLLLLRRATLAGRSIGEVARIGTQELLALVEDDETAAARVPKARPSVPGTAAAEVHLASAADALGRGDPARLSAALASAAADLGPVPLVETVLVPLMREIGEKWERGTLGVWQEHLASAEVRWRLESLRESHSHSLGGPVLLVGTPAGQLHEMGALLAAAVAAIEGWQVTYLGSDLPAEELAAAAIRRSARAVALSVVHPSSDPALARGLRLLRRLLPQDVAILIGGGAAASYGAAIAEIRAASPADLADFRAELGRLRNAPR